jgi:hypothetical protein
MVTVEFQHVNYIFKPLHETAANQFAAKLRHNVYCSLFGTTGFLKKIKSLLFTGIHEVKKY